MTAKFFASLALALALLTPACTAAAQMQTPNLVGGWAFV